MTTVINTRKEVSNLTIFGDGRMIVTWANGFVTAYEYQDMEVTHEGNITIVELSIKGFGPYRFELPNVYIVFDAFFENYDRNYFDE